MFSPFPHAFAGAAIQDFPPVGGFTALLIGDDLDDVLVDNLSDQKPFFQTPPPETLESIIVDNLAGQKPFLLTPPPETLESLIPPSVLSGYLAAENPRIPSFPHSSHSPFFRGEEFNPRKRALEHVPVYSSFSESQQVQIPMLHSPDEFPFATVMPSKKVPRIEAYAPFSQPAPPTLESILSGFSLSEFVSALMASPENDDGAPMCSPTAEKGKKKIQMDVAKDRRRRISEKVRSLGKLLPTEQKMNTATMLEEVYAYIKFLQAQIQALSSMPAQSAYCGVSTESLPYSVDGLLGSLSRQQLLQVVVNSPAAQAVLTSEKCCVVSAEQVALLKKLLIQRLSAAGF